MKTWLISKQFVDPTDIMLLGKDEEEVVKEVHDSLPSDNSVPWDLTARKQLKKLWLLCKQSTPDVSSASAASARPADDLEAALPDGVPEQIEKNWVAKHGFHLSGARMLIGGDFNRIYNCLNRRRPRELPKMDPEKFRLANEGVTGESKGMFLSEDGKVHAKKEFYSEIIAHDMLWWKVRAYLSTVCYLMIMVPDFFPLQACENFADALHDVILAPTRSNGRLTLTQCKIAWKAMISAMHVRIHQSGCTLASLTENEMFWKHHWAWHSGGRVEEPSDERPNRPTEGERRLQSSLDKAANLFRKGGGGRGGRQGGGRGGNPNGGGRKRSWGQRGQDNSQQGARNFNQNIPQPPNGGGGGGGKGQSAGQKAWNKRGRKGQGK